MSKTSSPIYFVPMHNVLGRFWLDEDSKKHRQEGPAEEHVSGVKAWYWHGQYMCSSGGQYPMFRSDIADKQWNWGTEPRIPRAKREAFGREWLDEEYRLHRRLGPAVESDNGQKTWYWHGSFFLMSEGHLPSLGDIFYSKENRWSTTT